MSCSLELVSVLELVPNLDPKLETEMKSELQLALKLEPEPEAELEPETELFRAVAKDVSAVWLTWLN